MVSGESVRWYTIPVKWPRAIVKALCLEASCIVAAGLVACSADRDNDPAPAAAREPEPVARQARREAPEPQDPPSAPALAQQTARALDFRKVRVTPERYVGTTQLCDVRFAEGPLPVETVPVTAALAATGQTRPPPSKRMNIECASSQGHGTWIDLRISDSVQASDLEVGSRIEVEVVDPYGGTAGHSMARFLARVGPGEAPPRDQTTPPSDGFDFSQVRRRRSILRTTQTCRVDFASQLTPIERQSRARPAYPEGASSRMDLRCLHEGGDSWLDLVFDEQNAEESLRVVRGSELPLVIRTARGGYADYPVVQISDAETQTSDAAE